MRRAKLLRMDERGSRWGTLPKQWHTQREKLNGRLEIGPCWPLWFPPFFKGLVFLPVSFSGRFTSTGPSGCRFEVSIILDYGAVAFARQTPCLKKPFFAPSRCCCVQIARSYQACLTSASVNTTRCHVDVLISAWNKKMKRIIRIVGGGYKNT